MSEYKKGKLYRVDLSVAHRFYFESRSLGNSRMYLFDPVLASTKRANFLFLETCSNLHGFTTHYKVIWLDMIGLISANAALVEVSEND